MTPACGSQGTDVVDERIDGPVLGAAPQASQHAAGPFLVAGVGGHPPAPVGQLSALGTLQETPEAIENRHIGDYPLGGRAKHTGRRGRGQPAMTCDSNAFAVCSAISAGSASQIAWLKISTSMSPV